MKKITGSYYTPKVLSDFIVRYLIKNKDNPTLSILEPSVGDGIFIESLVESVSYLDKINITLVDINKDEIIKAENKLPTSYHITNNTICEDFLSFQKNHQTKYSLIFGNPPYIKGTLLNKEQTIFCEEIHCQAKLANRKINNIWTSFVIASTNMLMEDGTLAFVLPADLLQVKYAEEIRKFLEKEFSRLEIFTLDKSIFPNIDQQTVILFAHKKHSNKGTYFYAISDIKNNKFKLISSNGLMITQSKWTHYNLDKKEIKLLNKINERLPRVSDFITSKPGIVTGANSYFILSKLEVNTYNLKKFVLPIIQKGMFVGDNIVFSKKDFDRLVSEEKPTYLLSLKGGEKIHPELQKLLEIGETNEINKRYKCSIRDNWYSVPNIYPPSEAWIFKRSHLYPKLIVNSAGIRTTDAAYNITTKNGYNIESFIYSFYNTITLIFAELTGRKYGGGVLELTPNEFKNLPIPYLDINLITFKKFNVSFNKIDYKNTLLSNNITLFENLVFLDASELPLLSNIYNKLLLNRLR